MNQKSKAGFTLIEMLVALAILSLLAMLASSAFDGSRSKAQAMVNLARQVADANIQLKTDTGCYANVPKALFDPTAAQETTNNYCGRVFGNTWARPYLAQYPVDVDGNLVADKIGAGVKVSLVREAGGMGQRYIVSFSDVPMDVIKQALIECNNTDEDGGDLSKDRCRALNYDKAGTGVGTFEMQYDTSR